jgi:hypothetical protein
VRVHFFLYVVLHLSQFILFPTPMIFLPEEQNEAVLSLCVCRENETSMLCTSSRESRHYVCERAHTHRHAYPCLRKILTFIFISNHICPTGTLFTLLITQQYSRTPSLTALANPNPLHHPRAVPARNGQCRIHARPERTRPLTGAGIEAARRLIERRPCRFPVHATAPCSNVTIAGHNMHVKSTWESVLQLAVLPQLVNLFQ